MTNKDKNISLGGNLSENDEIILTQKLRIALSEHQIESMEKEIYRQVSGSSLTLKNIMRIAAVMIVILSVPALVYFLSHTGDTGIFKDYYAPYGHQNVSGIYRGQESGEYIPFFLYSTGNYARAVPKLREYLNENPADLQVRLLLAVCLIEEKQFNEAEVELTELILTSDYYFRDDALWYLALLSVRKGDFDKAHAFLRPIENSKVYGSKVQSLVKVISPPKPQ